MALAFYEANYDLLFHGQLKPGKKHFLGLKSPRVCRFCDRHAPEVGFKKDAHAVSRLTGNTMLFTYEECSVCNEVFSKLEDDLGKFTLPARVFGQVPGYKKVPSLKLPTGRMDMRPDNLRVEIDPAAIDQVISDDPENHKLTVSIPMQPYRPLGVYKAFVKMAMTIMPSGELGRFQETLHWLASAGVEENAVSDGLGFQCVQTFCQKVYRFPIVRLLRKKPESTVPYATFILSFGSFTFQIFLTGDDRDLRKHERVAVQAFPPPQLILGTAPEDWVDVNVISLSSPEKVTGAVWRQDFKYQMTEEPEVGSDSTRPEKT